MTATSRPNLGGLFSGTTPPERSSSIADALRPRGTDAEPAGSRPDAAESTSAGASSAPTTTPTPKPKARQAPTPTAQAGRVAASGASGGSAARPAPEQAGNQWAALQWLDPVRALGYYFDFLQGVFDAQRRVTMGVAAAVTAPIRRAGVWR